MRRPSTQTARYLLAVLAVIAAIPVFLKGFDLAYTAGDGMMEPPQVCNAACQQGWKVMGNQGGHWLDASFLLILIALVLVVLNRWPLILRWRPFGASR